MIVLDSSTMILVAKIDMLEIFISNVHSRVLIPERVKSEVYSGKREDTLLITKLIEDKKIHVLRVKNSKLIRKLMEDFDIEAGEAEALALAVQENAAVIATDDRNAIRACKILKKEFTTAIAVLIRALEKRLIDKDEALIKLQKLESIARYSRLIIENAKKQIKGGV